MSRFRARCKLGFDLNTQVHHCRDEPGIVGAAIYREILIDQRSIRSHPNKAVDVVVCPTSWIDSGSRFINFRSCPPKPITWRLSSRFRASFPWPARLPPRSVPTSRCAAARTLLHSPTAGVVIRPASGPPLPPLSSSHSSHHARRAATHIVVGSCPVRTAPRYTARSPPAACAPSYLQLC